MSNNSVPLLAPSFSFSPLLCAACVFSSPTLPVFPRVPCPVLGVLGGGGRGEALCVSGYLRVRPERRPYDKLKRKKNPPYGSLPPLSDVSLCLLATNVCPLPFFRGPNPYYLVTVYQPNPFSFPKENVDTCPSLA
ncbi:hypothetical protein CPAR01_03686 [Colletotrichum paranaense]|uniref:Secreted protein n=1 Tax=Colletotrichum paranaense TaxID=1914294 RepID=A0ABQ9SU81_9PEZI|nr:uncharacterized protein CPAR01_03686 [Colletotrichum paranaense]KAK1543053.1 hypothetical protein CPAR01_03686 [Colletotrichum paranaense]